MEVWIGHDPEEFAARARPYLVRERLTANVFGVHLAGVMAGARPPGNDDLWATAADGGLVLGAAMHTPPARVFLGRMPPAAAGAIAGALAGRGRPVPGVNGELATTRAFAAATRAALDLGAADVVLYTDLANPTSNSIYQRIGYRPDHDAEERGFEP